jgi:hypothetical protein
MDETQGMERRPGGSVEPVDRAARIKEIYRIPEAPATERFELRDPHAEVIHRANTFEQMVSTAERTGAIRFQAIGADGKRTQVFKVDGQWVRGDREARPKVPSKDDTERGPNVAPIVVAPPVEVGVRQADADSDRKQHIAKLEAALNERYLIKRAPFRIGTVGLGQTEYHYRGDISRVAFTESPLKLSTDSNNPSVARSMVDVAEARGWQALRVSGHEDFKRLVWLEASLRGVRTLGYEPVPGDHEFLRKEREARQVNRIEPVARQASEPTGTAKASGRGSGGRKAVLAALEAILVAKRVPAKQREAVMTAAAENLAQRLRNGETHRIKVYDKDAPSQRPTPASTREPQRARERSPAR